MDMTISPMHKLPIHEHPLFLSAMFVEKKCGACMVKEVMYGSYFCNEAFCDRWFHKECAESPLEINHHPSHPDHHLLLTEMSPAEDGTPCDVCGQEIRFTFYNCPTCEFKVDLICGTKPSPPFIQHPVCHNHKLMFLKKRMEEGYGHCEVCKKHVDGPSYSCSECTNVYFHLDCVHLSKEVYHFSHSSHPLKIMPRESLIEDDISQGTCWALMSTSDDDYAGNSDDDDDDGNSDDDDDEKDDDDDDDDDDGNSDDDDDEKDDDKYDDAQISCCFCFIKPKKVLYHCSICNFTLCLGCTKRPPPLVVDDAKTHSHPLTLFPNKISFTCKVNGLLSNGYISYICLKCAFVVSGHCIGLPRIININRHDHRISFRPHLGHKGAKCGVCWKRVSQYYGAYSCSVCIYVVHSRCAVDFNLWNGVELEGIPETSEDIVPFKVMGDNLIRHFFHDKHILLFLKDYDHDMVGEESVRCEACVSPIGFGPVYSCQECRFFLHEKCASLPMKKNLVFDPRPYKLEYTRGECVYCDLCSMFSGGFKYRCQRVSVDYPVVDVHCSSISEPFFHNAHFHPLYFVKPKKERCCIACGRGSADGYSKLICSISVCKFALCVYCATLPEKIWHICDEHPLTLYYYGGEEETGENWCEVCEMGLDTDYWFYTCCDCIVTLHVQCILGDFSRLTPNCSVTIEGKEYLVVLNCQNSRPFCRQCHYRCKAPVILQVNDDRNGYICSISCLWRSLEFETCLGK